MRKAALFCNDAKARDTVFGAGRWERISRLVDIHPAVVTQSNIDEELPRLAEIEVILSTWGMFVLTPQQLAKLPQTRYCSRPLKRHWCPDKPLCCNLGPVVPPSGCTAIVVRRSVVECFLFASGLLVRRSAVECFLIAS